MTFKIDHRLFSTASVALDELSPWDFLSDENKSLDVVLAFASAFWPNLIEIDGFVFLAEYYDEEYYKTTIENYGEELVERTINTCYLQNIFGPIDDKVQKWEAIGRLICESWKSRAELQYPNRRFATRFNWYSEMDPGVVLFSIRK